MNPNYKEALKLMDQLVSDYSAQEAVQMVVAPPGVYLSEMAAVLSDIPQISLAAQNVSLWNNGAYTGEISAEMLVSLGVQYCIVGHSERRKYFSESNEEVGRKVKMLLEHGIVPIICVGENLNDRKLGIHLDAVKEQLLNMSKEFSLGMRDRIIIAYEPVWAIGTGENAEAHQVSEMHQFILEVLQQRWPEHAAQIPLLYGGSCKPSNAEELFAVDHVHGGLIGGASLKSADFLQLARMLV